MASPLVNPFRGHSLLGLLALLAGLVAYLGLGAWLMTAAAWSGTCDYDSGTRVTRLFNARSCSPELLAGGPIEILLFLWLWVFPAFVLFAIVYGARNRRRREAGGS